VFQDPSLRIMYWQEN